MVHKKTATALAITAVHKEDEPSLAKLIESVRLNFNDRSEEVRLGLSWVAFSHVTVLLY